jgi:NodT family efflux transporter outer membrane factor (OMF) lipoprotein
MNVAAKMIQMRKSMRMVRKSYWFTASVVGLGLLAGCNVGPKYQRPAMQAPEAYKENIPAATATPAADGSPVAAATAVAAATPGAEAWKTAQPKDDANRGKWWLVFNDPQLNALEDQLNVSNQNIAAASANYLASRAVVREARAQLYPTVTTSPAISVARQPVLKSSTSSSSSSGSIQAASITTYNLPVDASYSPDLWGRVRNTIKGDAAAAQISAADLQNVRLTMQADLAVDYFLLRNQDALTQLLDTTVGNYQESLRLTKALYETGIDSDEAVAQAETQLESAQAQDANIGILRAQYEHAIAVLIGKAPAEFSLAAMPLQGTPPMIPPGVPAELLERRPDIASAERAMAQANAQIGVAKAAFYPNVTLNAAFGFESADPATWLTWPSRIWSVGPSVSQFIFDGGLRKATVLQYRATYDQTVANYRQTVLAAFQQVEDNLSALRILSQQIQLQDAAVKSAQRNLTVATDRYRLGIDPYLNVLTAQTSYLTNEQAAVSLRVQQMNDTVQLIQALGGGWDASQLASEKEVSAKLPEQPKGNP